MDLLDTLKNCNICPRSCKVNRTSEKLGFCKSNSMIKLAKAYPHMWEEPCISGERGSGTVFFSNCNLNCVFCQNFEISHEAVGKEISIERLSEIFLEQQGRGCHNINLVTPTHFVPQIISAVKQARLSGLQIPIVYNTSGYELVEIIQLLDGIIDIYLPDAKYADDKIAEKYSKATNYSLVNKKALQEMYRQVGNLKVDNKGVAISGLIIRHLVLPENLSGTEKVLNWIAKNISQEVYISLMAQYFPAFQASEYSKLSHRISQNEYKRARRIFDRCGLLNGWIQQYN